MCIICCLTNLHQIQWFCSIGCERKLKGLGRNLSWLNSRYYNHFSGRTEKNHDPPQLLYQLKFDIYTFKIQVRHLSQLSQYYRKVICIWVNLLNLRTGPADSHRCGSGGKESVGEDYCLMVRDAVYSRRSLKTRGHRFRGSTGIIVFRKFTRSEFS